MKVEKTGINNVVTAPLHLLLHSEFILIHCLVRLAMLKQNLLNSDFGKRHKSPSLQSLTKIPSLQCSRPFINYMISYRLITK